MNNPPRARVWTDEQVQLQEWLALPKRERSPKTQTGFAKKLGVSRTTLHNWRKLPGFQEAVNAMARIELAKQVPDVYDAIAREAIAGSYQHAKLMLELLEEYEETLNLNVDDKREKVNARLDELAERRRARMGG